MPKERPGAKKLETLRGLSESPQEQYAYALRLIAAENPPDVVSVALAVVTAMAKPDARPVLLAKYAYYAEQGVRRDPESALRVALLKALAPFGLPGESTLLEQAATTYEFLPPYHTEAAGNLRANALIHLSESDPTLARYHATRLLTDPHTSPMSGEPAVMAVEVLVAQGEFLPLYAYVVDGQSRVSEVVSACLRHLTALPPLLLDGLVQRYGKSEDDIVLAGLFDLILAHPAGSTYNDFILTFLRKTSSLNLYRYVVMGLSARKESALIAALMIAAKEPGQKGKAAILSEIVPDKGM